MLQVTFLKLHDFVKKKIGYAHGIYIAQSVCQKESPEENLNKIIEVENVWIKYASKNDLQLKGAWINYSLQKTRLSKNVKLY